MSTCDSIPTRLSLRLDGQLSAAENAELEDDLRRCPHYLPLAQTLTQLDLMFRSEPLLPPARDLTGAVIARIEQRREQRLLGLTFLLGAVISLIPTLLVAAALLFGFVVSTQPGLATEFIAGLARWLGQVAALFETLATVRNQLFSPWFLPALAAAASLGLLGATALWARRFTPALNLP
ncbi:MAG: zf-HC2 domain-containing protein [Caldilineales bacterium]|nr:zf-HC2 domain-containing protein [Caldilineales bacterium]MCW5860764.1 zf-HC2 domain-containing protein [Caldilineales bacterium]